MSLDGWLLLIERNLLTIRILEAIEESTGCLLCYLWSKNEKRYMEYLLTCEIVMDPGFRNRVILAKGFCNHHAHLLYKTTQTVRGLDGGGYALYMESVFKSILEELESRSIENLKVLDSKRDNGIITKIRARRDLFLRLRHTLRQVVQRRQPCPACESLLFSDRTHLHTLVEMLSDEGFRKEFKSSKGLCLPHFMSAIRFLGTSKLKNSADIHHALVHVEKERLRLVTCYLSEFLRKQSWDARNEPKGFEANANMMALEFLVGAQGLYMGHGFSENEPNEALRNETGANVTERGQRAATGRIQRAPSLEE